MAAEREARLQHRLTRKPRTRGVLFKRLNDGSLVNVDHMEKRDRRKKKNGQNRIRGGKHSTGRYNDTDQQQLKRDYGHGALDDDGSEILSQSMEKEGENIDPAGIHEKVHHVSSSSSPTSKSAWSSGPPSNLRVQTRFSTKDKDKDPSFPKDCGSNKSPWATTQQMPQSSPPISPYRCKIALGPILSSWSPFSGRYTDPSDGLARPSSSFPQLNETSWYSR